MVERGEGRLRRVVVGNVVEEGDKVLMVVRVEVFKLDGEIREVVESVGGEEERSMIMVREEMVLVWGKEGWEVVEMGYDEELERRKREMVGVGIVGKERM